ncbi:unnamed protein product [Periconia digitata]|uniref:MARVEL domain-containing protein n=1 Tax=Periconia digitata TaxID=1303443 RepID=A0A9W4XJ26_9PLEO|nr:unnamed protein product [Periconia digitata]
MRINTSYVQKCKTVAHFFQGLVIFIAGCITIAILTQDGEIGGPTRYYFAMCFVTLPALIYLTMVPMWSRAQKFANAYAFVALDALYTVLWLAAFMSVAIWNTQGVTEGAEERKLEERNCTTFKYGPESKCNLSRATVGLGVFICVLFVITTAISGYYVRSFRKEGVLPYEASKEESQYHATGGDPSSAKDPTWSTEMQPHDHSDDEEDRRTEHGGNQADDEYALLHGTETDEGRHPGRPLSWGNDPRMGRYAAYDDGAVDAASALSPGGYDDYRRDAHIGMHASPTPPPPGPPALGNYSTAYAGAAAPGAPLPMPMGPVSPPSPKPHGGGQGYSFSG